MPVRPLSASRPLAALRRRVASDLRVATRSQTAALASDARMAATTTAAPAPAPAIASAAPVASTTPPTLPRIPPGTCASATMRATPTSSRATPTSTISLSVHGTPRGKRAEGVGAATHYRGAPDGGSAGHRARRGRPAVGDRAPREPVVRSGRPARERDRLAGGGRLRRGGVTVAQRRAEAARDGALRPGGAGDGSGHAQPGAQSRAGGGAAAVPPGVRPDRAAPAPGDEADEGLAPPAARVEAPPRRAEAVAAAARAGRLASRRRRTPREGP